MTDTWANARSVSIFFSAGDFAEAYRRYKDGEAQGYGTHNEVAQLIDDLRALGLSTTIYSFMTEERREDQLADDLRIVSLGSQSWVDHDLLVNAVKADTSDLLIPHFPNLKMLKACLATGRRTMLGMATSYNLKTIRTAIDKKLLSRALSNPKLSLVTNHCWPSSMKLAEYGVPADKIVPWDVPHPFSPDDFKPKSFPTGDAVTIGYAGSIMQAKGVGDIIHAVSILKRTGKRVKARFAGTGEIEEMTALAQELGVAEEVTFLGMIPNTEVISLFRNSDIICIPSRHDFPEGFPLTMFEAIATRTPIACSDHPMFQLIMLDGKRAAMFKAQDPASLADAVERLISSPELYESVSRNADESWRALGISANWRKLITEWAQHGPQSDWIREHTLEALRRRILEMAR